MRNKATTIPEPLLTGAREIISRHMGLHFPEDRRNDLERGLRPALRDFGFEDVLSGMRWLVSSILTKSHIEVLARHLTVGETYFFRGKRCFDFLGEQVLPELIGRRRSEGKYLRVWSAGCCSGEEPYSVAILLARLLPDIEDWNINILGTDINPLFLEKARSATYGNWSFRDAPKWIRERFFTTSKDNLFKLLPEIRRRVNFIPQNLVENSDSPVFDTPVGVDLLLCRNVIMYLTPSHQREVIRRLKASLTDGGWLIVSPSEVSDGLFHDFEAVRFRGATFYRNSLGRAGKGRIFRAADSTAILRHGSISTPSVDPQPEVWEHLGSENNRKTTPGQTNPDADRPDLYQQALSLYGKSRYSEAAEKLRNLLYERPENGKAAILLSRICANQRNLSEAMELCDRAISAEKTEAGHYYLRAVIFQEQGRTEDAAADLRRALYLDQDFVPAHLLLGNLALRSGKRQESARYFKNILGLLRTRAGEEIVPGAEGLTVGRIREIIESTGLEVDR